MADTSIDLLAPVHRLSVEQYEAMGEAGLFDPEVRVELIDGLIVEMRPQSVPHMLAIAWLNKLMVPQLADDDELFVMPQLPVRMPALRSVPEPDIWVGREIDIRSADVLPLLVIEVAVSSLGYDRLTKSRLYARQGVPDYWIVNVAAGDVEVHRSPSGDTWTERTVHGAGETLRPLTLPGVEVELNALLSFMRE